MIINKQQNGFFLVGEKKTTTTKKTTTKIKTQNNIIKIIIIQIKKIKIKCGCLTTAGTRNMCSACLLLKETILLLIDDHHGCLEPCLVNPLCFAMIRVRGRGRFIVLSLYGCVLSTIHYFI